MAEIVSLNRVRKAKAQDENRAKATANAAKFGQTKAEKALQSARTTKSSRDLDGIKRE